MYPWIYAKPLSGDPTLVGGCNCGVSRGWEWRRKNWRVSWAHKPCGWLLISVWPSCGEDVASCCVATGTLGCSSVIFNWSSLEFALSCRKPSVTIRGHEVSKQMEKMYLRCDLSSSNDLMTNIDFVQKQNARPNSYQSFSGCVTV